MDNLLKIYIEKKNNLFQSEAWQDFQRALGHETWWVSCDDEATLVIKKPLYKGKNYLYVPHGPFCTEEGWHVFLKKVREIARSENCVFIRVEPLRVPNDILKKLNFKKVQKRSPLSRQYSPENTLFLDITKNEKEIMAQMKPKGRYNIRVAERKGVKVRQSQKREDLKTFYRLTTEMKERGFSSFEFDHFEKMLVELGPKKILKIFLAEYKKEPLAALLVVFYNDVAIYLHGASSNEKREFMPNHLAQWQAILEAKEKGCQIYDFWGIAPEDDPEHPWAGITRFKKSFGGEPVQFLGAYDLTFQPFWYRMFSLMNLLRKAFRR